MAKEGFSRRYWREGVLIIFLALNIFVWVSVQAKTPSNSLRIYFLDVGQGDAILVDTPSHKRLLVDGGASRDVLSRIGESLPFDTDRIDVLVETHPDKDHIGGLPAVVEKYEIGVFLEPGVLSENTLDDELHKRLDERNVSKLLARRGMNINFGDGASLLILFPNQDVSNWETNDASVVAKLSYGNKSFLLTGDSSKKAEFILYGLNPSILDSDVLKAGHHGSRTSTSLLYAEAVSPEYAVISAGKDNSYGHPHQEVLDILNSLDTKIVSIALSGTITFETDGNELYLK